MAESPCCEIAMFGIVDYCQVISRTWNLQFNEISHPLILECLPLTSNPNASSARREQSCSMTSPHWRPPILAVAR